MQNLGEAHVHCVDDGLRRDAVLLVVGSLDGAAAIGFADGLFHGVSHAVGVEDGAALNMARGAAHGLDERAGGAQETFFVGVENGDERDLGQVKTFAQQVDADEHVVFAFAQTGEKLDALQGFNLGVHVAAAHADLRIVAGEVFGHALGERGDEDALVSSLPGRGSRLAGRRSGP